jgi:hypothetical protein
MDWKGIQEKGSKQIRDEDTKSDFPRETERVHELKNCDLIVGYHEIIWFISVTPGNQ